jgi:hypothetical protein
VAGVADAHSSWRKYESNPLLASGDGHFGNKGLVLKAGLNSGWVLSQVLVLRKTRKYRAFAIINFGLAAFIAATASHNYGVARR